MAVAEGESAGRRNRYSEDRFLFGTNEHGSRRVIRPNELLVKHGGSEEAVLGVFKALGRDPRIGAEELPEPDRVINDEWGVFIAEGDPDDAIRRLFEARDAGNLPRGTLVQPNTVYFVTTLKRRIEDSLRAAPNYAVPNYAVPNYAVPNYAVPNYAVPNYAVPNYAVPNYAVPNYAVPNYAVPNYAVPNYAVPNYAVHGGGTCCETCVEESTDQPEVPFISARAARVAPCPLDRAEVAAEIFVLDVRDQVDNGSDAAAFIADLKANLAGKNAADIRDRLVNQPGALLPEALFYADEFANPRPEVEGRYVEEPLSAGMGANANHVDDGFVDPATNHGIFIKGIIDRLISHNDGSSYVRLFPVMGSLGDVSDAELVRALVYLQELAASEDAARNKDDVPIPTRILCFSLAGYPDHEEGEADILAETLADMQEKGWKVIASAGNDGSCRKTRPASLPDVLAVGAYGPGGPAGFSNYGPWVDACAPGVGVVSDFPAMQKAGLDVTEDMTAADEFATGLASWSGTSFAAPFVAAMVCRYMAANGVSYEDAVAELVEHDEALAIPGYGTIVGYRTQRVNIAHSGDWI